MKEEFFMSISRWASRALALVALGALFALSACSTNTLSPQASNPTSTPASVTTATPTPGLTTCTSPFSGEDYSSTYYTTLPELEYSGVKEYAQIMLPSQTRHLNDSASGRRHDYLCSAGTTDSVLTFMTQQLTQLGWQKVSSNQASHCETVPNYANPQCWQKGKYNLFMGINSNADWMLAFIDPAFLP